MNESKTKKNAKERKEVKRTTEKERESVYVCVCVERQRIEERKERKEVKERQL